MQSYTKGALIAGSIAIRAINLRQQVEELKTKIIEHDNILYMKTTGKLQTGLRCCHKFNKGTVHFISNGNRTEWSPIRSVIIRVITKSDDRAAGVRFVYHEYDYRPNWTTRSPITN